MKNINENKKSKNVNSSVKNDGGKNAKNNTEKNKITIKMHQKKKKGKKFAVITTAVLGLAIITGFVFMQLGFGAALFNDKNFYEGTEINGINVSGMTAEEAEKIISANLLDKRNEVKLELTYQNKKWAWQGEDFELNNNIQPIIQQTLSLEKQGNILVRRAAIKNTKKNGKFVNISEGYVLGGLEEKLAEIAAEIEREEINAEVVFQPDGKEQFTFTEEQSGIKIDFEKLKTDMAKAFSKKLDVKLQIPVTETEPKVKARELKEHTGLRAKFSTSVATSSEDRKHNVKKALNAFNGMKIEPGEEISFNKTTGPRTKQNGYKMANIILNGVFVEGVGGGVCQSSTTLYNALLLAGLEILEVRAHSLPVSYVPLAFDAMVSEGYADLVFKNNTEHPIYIKACSDDTTVSVEIYGNPFEEGFEIVRKADFVKTLPHSGDRIVKDKEKYYSKKITYEGEYFRLKYPHEGYESRAILQSFKNGKLLDEKVIRTVSYKPQEGIIIEGTERVMEGVTLPDNNVKFIPPQNANSKLPANSIAEKIKQVSPEEYTP